MIYMNVLQQANAQTCVDDYYQINYTTSTVQYFTTATTTAQNEILFASTVRNYRSTTRSGWVTKLSPQGTILFSKYYGSGDFNYIQFTKAIPADKDNYFVAGNIGNVDTTTFPEPTPLTQYGFLMKIDKYGNIIWQKMFGKIFISNLSSGIDDIIPLTDGDYALSLSYSAAENSANIVVRIDVEGNLKWTTTFTSDKYSAYFGPARIKQLRNGNLIVAQQANLIDLDHPYTAPPKLGYYTVCMDSKFGTRIWDKNYTYTSALSGAEKAFGEIANITELPGGDISILTSYADTAYIYFRKTTKVINILTDNLGKLKKITAYQNAKPPVYTPSAAEVGANGDQVVLMDNSDAPYLMRINAAGEVQWQNAYAGTGRSQETKSVLSTPFGFYFFSFTHNGGSTDLRLVKTDINGNADCVQTPLTIITNDVTPAFQILDSAVKTDATPGNWYTIAAIGVADYKMHGDIVCRKTCCTDVTDTAAKVDLCNAVSYTLPNNDIIKNTGTYNIVYKTSKGCDSIVYYNVTFSTNPVVGLGPDNCLDGKDSVVLKTAAGYNAYNWAGTVTSNPSYTIKKPGTYIVSVTNACGTTKDTIQVFQQCEFAIFMPNAFTPNSDNLNDVFRIPKTVTNRLISFTIFNRWGQIVFATRNISEGWNGNFKEFPAPMGTYVYNIVMETVDQKKKLSQKGLVTLIR